MTSKIPTKYRLNFYDQIILPLLPPAQVDDQSPFVWQIQKLNEKVTSLLYFLLRHVEYSPKILQSLSDGKLSI